MPSTDKKQSKAGTRSWKFAVVITFAVLFAAVVLYVANEQYRFLASVEEDPGFVGSSACRKCHQEAYHDWQGSHHDKAMDIATESTVLGDFDDVQFTDPFNGVTSRFFKEGSSFFVETEGPDGTLDTFQVTHTFGFFPLQQYLIPFPGGKLQCLNIAWDSRENKWYRLPPYEIAGHDDWLHWTKSGQNWNSMCAECHSTRLEKKYDSETNSYATTWFEIDVGCEACHGPGSEHVKWANAPFWTRDKERNYGLKVNSSEVTNKQQIAMCASCHSRRYQLGDNFHDEGDILDKMVPSLLDEGLYYPDGQILEEVYVYGSFVQSKMYMEGVQCSDCHNVHSLKLRKEKNDLCLQCHRKEQYETPSHHFHKLEHEGKPNDGAQCIKCHMPGRTYMGNDYRLDHSFRIPRPDLSLSIGTPNSCSANGCHSDKSIEWVNQHYTKWYGEKKRVHYGEVFAGVQEGADQRENLYQLAQDEILPEIVRATALSLLRNYPGSKTTEVFIQALQSPHALLRYVGVRNLGYLPEGEKLRFLVPRLYDKVKAVRMEAALVLASVSESAIEKDDKEQFFVALEEYREAMIYNSDFAPQRYNLGNLAMALREPEKAIAYYSAALEIDKQFYPAKVNLAMQYNQLGENKKAAQLLREVVQERPEQYAISYSLGLLLAEIEEYEEAAVYLGRAADGMPEYSRVRYNQGLVFLKMRQWEKAEKALMQVIETDPLNREYFWTLANFYLDTGEIEKAKDFARYLLQRVPVHRDAEELLRKLQ